MHYNLSTAMFMSLDEEVKAKISFWLDNAGVELDRLHRVTIDMTLWGMAVHYYVLDKSGHPMLDEDYEPIYEQQWIALERGYHRPDFLEYMVPSQDPPAHLPPPGSFLRN